MLKFTFGVILVSFTALSEESNAGFHFVKTDDGRKVLEVKASKLEARGSVMHLSGNVEIKADRLTIHAKEADFNPNTAEIETHGPVHIQLSQTQNR